MALSYQKITDLQRFTKIYWSTIGWKVNMTRRLNDKEDYGLKKMNEIDYGLKETNEMDYGLKEMNEMDYTLKEINNLKTKAEGWEVEWSCHDGTQVLWNQ